MLFCVFLYTLILFVVDYDVFKVFTLLCTTNTIATCDPNTGYVNAFHRHLNKMIKFGAI